MQPQLKFWLGYVKVKLAGKHIEAFINLTAEKQLQIWDIHFKSGEAAEFTIVLRHFFLLRPLLRKTGCKLHVIERKGAPFFWDKLATRKFLILAMVLFAVGLFLMSSIIWQVNVIGNDKIKTVYILEVARQQGIHPLQWKFKLANPENLSRAMQRQLPATSWVGVRYHGTQMTIEIVEAAKPEAKPLVNPRNLISSVNAIITDIKAEKGMPMVKTHAFVRKGDVLISGVIGKVPNQQIVVAKGEVRGEVWYTSHIEVPLIIKQDSHTGESAQRFYLVFGNRALQITGFRQRKFELFTSEIVRKSVHWHKWTLPIGWIQENQAESQTFEQKSNVDEAIKLGMEHAQTSLLIAADPRARIISQKILHQRLENGKVYIEAHFEVEQSIVQEQPIIQGE